MHLPQVLVFEIEGRLANLLRPVVEERRWSLREPRRMETCLQHLQRGGPGVVVIRMGPDLERELSLLERVTSLHPGAPAIVVGESDHPGLASLAWDLGASYVLVPPQPRDLLPEVVVGLMAAVLPREARS